MASMAVELEESTVELGEWIETTVLNFVVAVLVALTGGFAFHFVWNAAVAVTGRLHPITGGYWTCALAVLGLAALLKVLELVVNVIRGKDNSWLGFASVMFALGVVGWLVTWLGPHVHT